LAPEPAGLTLPFRLLAIGDRSRATPASIAALARAGGADVALLLRDPLLSTEATMEWAAEALALCRPAGVRVLVHGSAIVARESGADGVHLPERASVAAARAIVGAGTLVGASRHDAEGVREAALAGADYTTLSPVFASPGKGKPLGLAVFAEIARSSGLPVVALGGIAAENAAACRAAGAAAVAAIRGVWEGDVARNVRSLL
jgi:thiamine-phosphate pyrophosphorylase